MEINESAPGYAFWKRFWDIGLSEGAVSPDELTERFVELAREVFPAAEEAGLSGELAFDLLGTRIYMSKAEFVELGPRYSEFFGMEIPYETAADAGEHGWVDPMVRVWLPVPSEAQ